MIVLIELIFLLLWDKDLIYLFFLHEFQELFSFWLVLLHQELGSFGQFQLFHAYLVSLGMG